MVTLSLFRHAKSSWDNPALADFERPLAVRGEKAASRMGRYMADEGLEPELVLCSSAVRARQTLELAAAGWRGTPEIRYEDGLYHAGSADMLEILRELPESCAHAMLIGHNPGFHALALELAAKGAPELFAAMASKFPTGALAVIAFDDGWSGVGPGKGTLLRIVTPKGLRAKN